MFSNKNSIQRLDILQFLSCINWSLFGRTTEDDSLALQERRMTENHITAFTKTARMTMGLVTRSILLLSSKILKEQGSRHAFLRRRTKEAQMRDNADVKTPLQGLPLVFNPLHCPLLIKIQVF